MVTKQNARLVRVMKQVEIEIECIATTTETIEFLQELIKRIRVLEVHWYGDEDR